MSTRKTPHPRQLLVEGKEDQRVIPEFMERFIPWGEAKERDKWPAEIIEFDGIEKLLKDGVIQAAFNSPGLQSLGVLVDADDAPLARWSTIRARAIEKIPAIPAALPPEGLVIQSDEGVRFGVWIMPNCSSKGMLETFLALFIDQPNGPLWCCVDAHCTDAKLTHQAPYRDAHADKAKIHAWLALQDPPGQQLHSAIVQNLLRPNSPQAEPFVKWFRSLYRV
ncbi:DUF3226 domain-containing protein [Gemmata sp. JC717]|uniref:DUF3226 domain-containing protein n=1 Tax=Gemmata algarum TaxID=2975278 RepID=UPI0021BAC374|nr:DUF3226 domain-containing protein [Gemmata algarum]MDY3556926.1 DUF3226 domain-containing protein [Gemmata algarum]